MATNLHPQMLQGPPLTLLDSREILLVNHIMAQFLKMHFIVPFYVISTEENRYK